MQFFQNWLFVDVYVKVTRSFLKLFYPDWHRVFTKSDKLVNVQSTGPWGCGSYHAEAFLKLISLWVQSSEHINVGGVEGVTSFPVVVCGIRILWIFSINHFLLFVFLQILYIKTKIILFIKLICANTIIKDLTPLWPLWWGHVFGQVHSPSTHIYAHTGYTCLYGTLEVWLADRPWTKPPQSQRETSEDLPLLTQGNVTK